VPVLHQRSLDGGYYIYANPSGRGNITYQIEERARSIVASDDSLSPGKDMCWPKLKTLQQLGVIYTGNSGTIRPETYDLPSEEGAEEAAGGEGQTLSISAEEAKEFLEVIKQSRDLNDGERKRVREWLGLPPEPGSDSGTPISGVPTPSAHGRLRRELSERTGDPLPHSDIQRVQSDGSSSASCTVKPIPRENGDFDTGDHEVWFKRAIDVGEIGRDTRYTRFSIGVDKEDGVLGAVATIDPLYHTDYPWIAEVAEKHVETTLQALEAAEVLDQVALDASASAVSLTIQPL